MTFTGVFQELMDGNPVTRTSWVEEDEARIVYYDTEIKSFVDRRASGEWQFKYLCVTGDDMNATDWEICEWQEGDKR
jgi:hypothetical protein